MNIETIRANIIKLCQSEVGTTEEPKGSNKTKYGLWFGFNGVAWCCIWVSWIFDSAGVPIRIAGNRKGFAHTRYIIEFSIKHNLFTDNPKAGDIAMLDFKKDQWIDHIGIFKEFDVTKGWPFIFEGNTSSDSKGSQDNGDGVYLKHRNPAFVFKYIDTEKLIAKMTELKLIEL